MPNGSCTITRAVIFQKVIEIYIYKMENMDWATVWFLSWKTCRFLSRRNTRYRVLCARRNTLLCSMCESYDML